MTSLTTSAFAFRTLKTTVVLSALTLLLSACGSNVKLDEAPVSDRTGTPVGSLGGAGGADGAAGTSRVVPSVTVDPRGIEQPPASVSRLVYFDYDSSVVRAEFTSMLETHARFLKDDRRRRVMLEGHTDDRGGREYNLALGQKRAEAVRSALGLLGVVDAQLEAVSFGKEKPATTSVDDEARAQNRRVELTYR